MIAITGVSGSGKSSLINETLYPILNSKIYNSLKTPLPYRKIEGMNFIDKVVEVNQQQIGRTPRSNPATFTGVYSEIRKLFSETIESKVRGYKPGRFSFNVVGGRCEICKGGGMRLIEMNFLPDVYVECEGCNGKRFNRETLEVRYKGKSISDILNMSVTKSLDFFSSIPKIYNILKSIDNVGLGYITLGQSSITLSGGESQRIKLATELAKKDTGKTLYILDEPTTGLHFEDIRILLNVLNQLVEKGNTIIIIEHNLDVIKQVDHIIDIGPEGGKNGGELVDSGSPKEIISNNKVIDNGDKYLSTMPSRKRINANNKGYAAADVLRLKRIESIEKKLNDLIKASGDNVINTKQDESFKDVGRSEYVMSSNDRYARSRGIFFGFLFSIVIVFLLIMVSTESYYFVDFFRSLI